MVMCPKGFEAMGGVTLEKASGQKLRSFVSLYIPQRQQEIAVQSVLWSPSHTR